MYANSIYNKHVVFCNPFFTQIGEVFNRLIQLKSSTYLSKLHAILIFDNCQWIIDNKCGNKEVWGVWYGVWYEVCGLGFVVWDLGCLPHEIGLLFHWGEVWVNSKQWTVNSNRLVTSLVGTSRDLSLFNNNTMNMSTVRRALIL